MRNPVQFASVELNNNRLALYCAQHGCCAVTKQPLEIGDIPVSYTHLYVRSEEAAEKVCEELNATTPWDFRSSDYQYLELDCLEHE